jgi:hypothetical protein
MSCYICRTTIGPGAAVIILQDICEPSSISPYAEMKCAHLMCWQVRQVSPVPASDQTVLTPNRKQKHDFIIPQDAHATKQCTVCEKPVTTQHTRVLTGPNRQLWCHLNCFCLTFNPRTQLVCGPETESDRLQAAEKWSVGIKIRPVFEVVEAFVWSAAMRNTVLVESPMHALLKMSPDTRATALEIRNAYRDPSITTGPRYETPIAKLAAEMAEKSRSKKTPSVLAFLVKNKVSPSDMITLGLKGDMLLTEGPEDWDIILNKAEFPVSCLIHVNIGMTFTRMLYRGVDIRRFCEAGYLENELIDLGFHAVGFLAARGTAENKAKVLETCKQSDFGFKLY